MSRFLFRYPTTLVWNCKTADAVLWANLFKPWHSNFLYCPHYHYPRLTFSRRLSFHGFSFFFFFSFPSLAAPIDRVTKPPMAWTELPNGEPNTGHENETTRPGWVEEQSNRDRLSQRVYADGSHDGQIYKHGTGRGCAGVFLPRHPRQNRNQPLQQQGKSQWCPKREDGRERRKDTEVLQVSWHLKIK